METQTIERRMERLAVRALEGESDEPEVAELLERIPETATGRVAAYRLCAMGTRNSDPAALEEAAAILTEPSWQARLTRNRGRLACQLGDLETGERLSREALHLMREHGFDELEPRVLITLGVIESSKGNAEEGLALLTEGRRGFARSGDSVNEGVALSMIGPRYQQVGAYAAAIEALITAADLLEGQGRDRDRTAALASLSRTYTRLGVYDEGVRCAEDALALAPAGSSTQIWAINALCHALTSAGDHEASVRQALKGVSLARQLRSEYPLLIALICLGDVCVLANDPDEADPAYDEALPLARQMKHLGDELSCLQGKALVLEKRGELQRCREQALAVLERVDQLDNPDRIMRTRELLSRVEEGLGNYEAAFGHLKTVNELRDRVFTKESAIRIRSVRAEHELRRERQTSSDALRQLSRRVMESREEERQRVAAELHDGLGQAVSLLAVEADLLAQSPPSEADESFRKIARSAQEIAEQIHQISHNLHPLRLAHLGVEAAVRVTCEEVARAHDMVVEFRSREVPRELPADLALCLYRIVQEGLHNAVRHGQADRITVNLDGEEGYVRLQVEDTGSGFDPDKVDSPGIGLASMRERTLHLDGSFTLWSRPGKGTRIDVELPIAKGRD